MSEYWSSLAQEAAFFSQETWDTCILLHIHHDDDQAAQECRLGGLDAS